MIDHRHNLFVLQNAADRLDDRCDLSCFHACEMNSSRHAYRHKGEGNIKKVNFMSRDETKGEERGRQIVMLG